MCWVGAARDGVGDGHLGIGEGRPVEEGKASSQDVRLKYSRRGRNYWV